MGLYRRKESKSIEAKRLTIENMEELARWCNGAIKGTSLPPENRIVQFYRQHYPEGECDAQVGDWLVKEGPVFYVYINSAFNEYFVQIGE